ncbi:PREDICTED: uncharacterized protein LOC108559688 [Nicrophorus vespilloides]|uniref:Uncharacterized protein LOC108559688 n=1 Tax=Nicrophorus vespilloides TaxID=110193 RepID=A0ABM1MD74_NICVS|nr:PREDICTED: uncharacterized protein LOC108559688 [Nicrophorus vespilloides]
MEKYTEEQVKEATSFAEFYIDLIENHRDSFSYYLSDNAILDWFGQTVKGEKNIKVFLKNHVNKIKHIFPNIEPCSKIGYRDTHVVKYIPRESKNTVTETIDNEEKTPPNKALLSPGGSRKREKGQGDGLHNCSDTPTKRTRLNDTEDDDPSVPDVQITNITSDGYIEFYRKSSKKFQNETKWSRPCKFQVAFSQVPSGYLIHLMIYQGTVKCKRNLLKQFDSVESGE